MNEEEIMNKTKKAYQGVALALGVFCLGAGTQGLGDVLNEELLNSNKPSLIGSFIVITTGVLFVILGRTHIRSFQLLLPTKAEEAFLKEQRKARKFAKDTRGVSPVIAVILMVAITVVLAATVFILVQDIGEVSESTPNVSFNQNQADATLTVIKADQRLEWGDFAVTNCTAPPATESVDAGDQLMSCNGHVTVVHTESNSLIWQGDF